MAGCIPSCSGEPDGLSKGDLDRITDSVRVCLVMPDGRRRLVEFLEEKGLVELKAAVKLWEKAAEVQAEAGRLSPNSGGADKYLVDAKERLSKLAQDVKNTGLQSMCTVMTLDTISKLQQKIEGLLEPEYQKFRQKLLNDYTARESSIRRQR